MMPAVSARIRWHESFQCNSSGSRMAVEDTHMHARMRACAKTILSYWALEKMRKDRSIHVFTNHQKTHLKQV